MDVNAKVERLTAHITDPVERERKQKNLRRALVLVETEPQEPQTKDNGQFDGLPAITLEERLAKESIKLAQMKEMRSLVFAEEEGKEIPEDLINKRGKFGYTPLIQAVVDQDYEAMQNLLDQGVLLNIQDNGGMTALEKAERAGDKKAIAMLKEFGAE